MVFTAKPTVERGDGFMFQVPRMNHDAVAETLPLAWPSPDIFLVAWSTAGRCYSVRVACPPTNPCHSAATGQQPMGVPMGFWLPGAMRIGKGHSDRQPLGQSLVIDHLFPPYGNVFRRAAGACRSFVVNPWRTRGIRSLEPGQEDQAGGPLHETADRRAIASPLDQITFPVTGNGASRHFRRTPGHACHVGDLAASIRPSGPRAACFACLPQGGQEEGTPQTFTGGTSSPA